MILGSRGISGPFLQGYGVILMFLDSQRQQVQSPVSRMIMIPVFIVALGHTSCLSWFLLPLLKMSSLDTQACNVPHCFSLIHTILVTEASEELSKEKD